MEYLGMAGYIQGIFWRGYWGYNQGINRVYAALNLGVFGVYLGRYILEVCYHEYPDPSTQYTHPPSHVHTMALICIRYNVYLLKARS